jgi:hypothetical protein
MWTASAVGAQTRNVVPPGMRFAPIGVSAVMGCTVINLLPQERSSENVVWKC